MQKQSLQIRRCRLHESRIVDSAFDPDALQPGHAWLAIQRLALTANNITYALIGERFRYWDAFPADAPNSNAVNGEPDDPATVESGWGIVPAWGFAEVIASRSPDVSVGERLYGYLPTATHLQIEVGRSDPLGWFDAAPHRQTLAAVYNRYQRCAADSSYDEAAENWIALFRPLIATAFLLDHFIRRQSYFGAAQFVFTSASSKTAQATARLLRLHAPARLIGLTSTSRVDAVRAFGCYDDVFDYEGIEFIPTGSPTVYLDFAGSGALRARLHRWLGDSLRHGALIGAAHGSPGAADTELAGLAPQVFFAPGIAQELGAEVGGPELGRRITACEMALRGSIDVPRICTHCGFPAIEVLYHELRRGEIELEAGHIWLP